jgi:hypothetical protein
LSELDAGVTRRRAVAPLFIVVEQVFFQKLHRARYRWHIVSSRMNGNPDIKWLFRVAEYLKVDIADLFAHDTSDINGYIEHGGQIQKISSIADLEEILSRAKAGK